MILRVNGIERIQGIIFDMDGVLIDSSSVHAEAFRRTFAERGIIGLEYREIAGLRTEEAVEKVLEARHIAASAKDLAALTLRKRRIAHELLSENVPLIHGCQEVVRKLSETFALILASCGSRAAVDLFIERSQCGNCFRHVISGNDISKGKPNPEIYLVCLDKLKLPAALCLALEDSLAGISAATQAGIPVVALCGTESREVLERTSAAAVIDTLEQLLGLLPMSES